MIVNSLNFSCYFFLLRIFVRVSHYGIQEQKIEQN